MYFDYFVSLCMQDGSCVEYCRASISNSWLNLHYGLKSSVDVTSCYLVVKLPTSALTQGRCLFLLSLNADLPYNCSYCYICKGVINFFIQFYIPVSLNPGWVAVWALSNLQKANVCQQKHMEQSQINLDDLCKPLSLQALLWRALRCLKGRGPNIGT